MLKATRCKNDPARNWRRKKEAGLTAAALLAGFVVLALMSPGQLDGLPGLCLWSRIAGQPCPACGTLHALCSLAHGDVGQALDYNRNVLVVGPLLLVVFIQQLRILGEGQWRRMVATAVVHSKKSTPPH